jgi:hypothetical protein
MTQEEQLVLNFLEASPESWFARREIARRAVKRRVYEEDRNWADNALSSLVAQRIVEQDANGLFRIRRRSS